MTCRNQSAVPTAVWSHPFLIIFNLPDSATSSMEGTYQADCCRSPILLGLVIHSKYIYKTELDNRVCHLKWEIN